MNTDFSFLEFIILTFDLLGIQYDLIICFYEFPYYIDKPGGIDSLNHKVEVDNGYESKGSFNLTYISEVKGTLPLIVYAAINPNWDVVPKSESNIGTLDYNSLLQRERIQMMESYNNAIRYAYEKAGKKVETSKDNIYISYIFEGYDHDFEVGDQIIEVDGQEITLYSELNSLVSSKRTGDKSTVKVLHNGKEYNRTVSFKYYEEEQRTIMGVSLIVVPELETNPTYVFHYDKQEYGPSGGLMISLSVYNQLVKEDITGGKTIAGTGTLDENGKVGRIGGIEYKLKGAVNGGADIFFVPPGENYEDAVALKKKRHYKIEIVKVETFDEALNYLEENVIKK